jgi:tRNA(fMet)-specific endonuclease VapC
MGNHSYLLDTNIISALAREPGGVVYATLKSRLPASVCTSIIVAAEIEYGLYKSGSQLNVFLVITA